MSRIATEFEQLKIDEANKLLFEIGLGITELTDKGGGAVTPLRPPKL